MKFCYVPEFAVVGTAPANPDTGFAKFYLRGSEWKHLGDDGIERGIALIAAPSSPPIIYRFTSVLGVLDEAFKLDGKDSANIPAVSLTKTRVMGFTFSNSVDNSIADIKLMVNDVVVFTWSVSTKRTAYKSNGLSGIDDLNAGDYFGLQWGTLGATIPADVVCDLHILCIDDTQAEGGNATI